MSCTIIPAIDLLGGRCVRLHQGDYGAATSYRDDPAAVAAEFASAGATRLHVVDLDAARGTEGNRDAITAIRKAFPGLLEVGGGIRSVDDVDDLLARGADRLVVGTVLARDPDLVGRMIARAGARVIAGVDAKDGIVQVSGWLEHDGLSDEAAARRASDLGCISIIYTNIRRDGTGTGPDLSRCVTVAAWSGLPVIASGGVGTAQHVDDACMHYEDGIVGVIAGKALYDGAIELGSLFRSHPPAAVSGMHW
ncbi:MAG: 1-(5-phosphoribosyl)-5-[(5-phosphoribosylamino)methylideneamino] imidazole-4-carboxamide isomerase [Spirochaetaceae bacterium]|nr:MAG: 1-(5-phosphoribosyl)-5-[(5-phosphoribosylamino)methylideneamino] imidazole-4-carboxamide isomerase [Spirochaetaceae bacterium]